MTESPSPPVPPPGQGASAVPGSALEQASQNPAHAANHQRNLQVINGNVLMAAHGLGGRLELYADRVRIVRVGYFNYFLGLLAGRPALIETTISLEHISSFDIVHPILFNDFISISYPGSPSLSGHPLQDSAAENALLMNFFDNRMFYAIKREIDTMISRPLYVTVKGNERTRSDRSSAEPGRSL